MPDTCDYLIIGAGIVGLTTGFELKKEPKPGLHASGRNSGVLHSGVYYGADTLKAKVCARGARIMREFAAEYGIRCDVSGKVIIATSEQDLITLDRLLKNAHDNQIPVEKLDEVGIRAIEPYAAPYRFGLFSPQTAVIDSKAVVAKLNELLAAQGVKFVFGAEAESIDAVRRLIRTKQGEFSYGHLFNCAGANADTVAKRFGLGEDYALLPFKGIYYKLRKERDYLVKSSIYPVPDISLPFLGVHLTRVISGDVYVGPTAIPAFGRENYGILSGIRLSEGLGVAREMAAMYIRNHQNFRHLVHTEIRKYFKPYFLEATRKLVPSVTSDDLIPCDKVGIRPQLVNVREKRLEMDFVVEETPHSIHVLNAISPAFTSSFAFAEWLVDLYERKTHAQG
jgi:L-2-hydroxyglutarate oxidase